MKSVLWCEDPGVFPYFQNLYQEWSKQNVDFRFYVGGIASGLAKEFGLKHTQGLPEITSEIKILVLGTGEDRSKFLSLLQRSKVLNVTTVAIVDSNINVLERFGAPERVTFSDYVVVPESASVDTLVNSGLNRSQIWLVGHPLYIKLFKENLTAPLQSFRKDKRKILFLGETRHGLFEEQFYLNSTFTLRGSGLYQHRMDIVLEEFLEKIKPLRKDFNLQLRMHPKNSKDDYRNFIGEFDKVSSGISIFEDIITSDLVVGMTSTAMVEAAVMGRETLGILTRPAEKNWLPTIAAGVTFWADNPQALELAITEWNSGKKLSNQVQLKEYLVGGQRDPWIQYLSKILKEKV